MTLEEKIHKLLALAGSPNENEAKLAMSKARELMAKYCIDVTNMTQEPEKVGSIIYNPPFHFTNANFKYVVSITGTLAKQFGCLVTVLNESQIRLYGFQTNLEVTKYCFDSILNQLRAEFRLGYTKERSITFTEGFWCGAATTIKKRFTLTVEESNALVVYDPVRAEVADKCNGVFKATYDLNSVSVVGNLAGSIAGLNVQIYKGVQESQQKGNMLQ